MPKATIVKTILALVVGDLIAGSLFAPVGPDNAFLHV